MDQTDLPEDVHVEHEPTIAWEPSPAAPDTEPTEKRLEGAFGWALMVERGPRAGLTYVLGPGETLVGRHPDSAIFFGDVTVSRHHARFTVDESGLRVEDLGSTNGTYVNGVRGDTFMLAPKDEVMVGKYLLLVLRGND